MRLTEFAKRRGVRLPSAAFSCTVRERLRRFFEVDAEFTVIATLNALAEKGRLEKAVVAKAIKEIDVIPEKVFPEILS